MKYLKIVFFLCIIMASINFNIALAKSGGKIVYSPVRIDFKPDSDGYELIEKKVTYSGVYIMNLDGTGKGKLASSCQASSGGISDVRFSPDEKKVSFIKEKSLWVINIDGTKKKNIGILNKSWKKDILYKWSPDSKKIAFMGDGILYIANTDGSKLIKAQSYGDNMQYEWSGDSKRIACNNEGDSQIFIRDSRNGNIIKTFNIDLAPNRQDEKEIISKMYFSHDNSILAVST
ncbi:MAG: hypothetical protein ABRQ37_27170, partial [Candidatus Eremiobacterota bacterium]